MRELGSAFFAVFCVVGTKPFRGLWEEFKRKRRLGLWLRLNFRRRPEFFLYAAPPSYLNKYFNPGESYYLESDFYPKTRKENKSKHQKSRNADPENLFKESRIALYLYPDHHMWHFRIMALMLSVGILAQFTANWMGWTQVKIPWLHFIGYWGFCVFIILGVMPWLIFFFFRIPVLLNTGHPNLNQQVCDWVRGCIIHTMSDNPSNNKDAYGLLGGCLKLISYSFLRPNVKRQIVHFAPIDNRQTILIKRAVHGLLSSDLKIRIDMYTNQIEGREGSAFRWSLLYYAPLWSGYICILLFILVIPEPTHLAILLGILWTIGVTIFLWVESGRMHKLLDITRIDVERLPPPFTLDVFQRRENYYLYYLVGPTRIMSVAFSVLLSLYFLLVSIIGKVP